MPVAPPTDPSLRPRARRPRCVCHPAVRCTSESRHPADQEFLRRNSSLRHPADSQRWRLATDHWQLLAGACPPGPRPAHHPLARSPQPACHPAVRRPAVRTRPQPSPFAIRDAQRGGLTTRTKHGQHASRNLPRNSSAHRQPADSPPRQPAPGDGQPPTGTYPSVLRPAHRPLARRPQVARADPRSQLRTTPPNSGRPAAPRARTPARRLTPQPGPKPPPRRRNPSQSVPQMISTAKPIVLITRTNNWRPVSRGLLEDAPHFTTLPPPRPGNPPLVPGDCPPDLLPAGAPRARRSQVACATPMRQPDGTASADPRSQLRTTPPNSGRPAAPRARTPARRLTPQPGPKPPPRRRNPSQSVPQMISTAKPIVLITRTNNWRPVSRGLLEDASHFATLPPPCPGNPPLVPGDCPPDLLPADAPRARRSQVACATPMRQPDGTASADPRSQLRTTSPNSGRPAAPCAHTPTPRLTPQPGQSPPPTVRPLPPK